MTFVTFFYVFDHIFYFCVIRFGRACPIGTSVCENLIKFHSSCGSLIKLKFSSTCGILPVHVLEDDCNCLAY